MTTTKLWWGLLLTTVAVAGVSAAGLISSYQSGGPPGVAPPDPFAQASTQRMLATLGSAGEIFALVYGVILMTTEFRHLTARPTFLIEPRRGRVIAAKLTVGAAVGVIYAIASAAVVAAVMTPWLGAKGDAIEWLRGGVLATLGRAAIAVTLYALLGVGIGAVVRNQIAAVIGSLAFLLIIENVFAVIPTVNRAYAFLPGPAAGALVGSTAPAIGGVQLTSLEGGLVCLGWGVLLAVCGWLVTMRRDIP
ncbi:MAG: ABC transporter permease [Candidatus Dormiibacterota bacterium]